MSREIDERIVEMQFDNKQFESGIAQTIKSLDKLTDALRFEGISKSLTSLQNGIGNLNFGPIADGLGALENTLGTFTGRLKMEVFDRLSNMAVNTGEKIFNALTIAGAKSGMAEYETQMGAVQTILANTEHLGTTITDVNAALDDLNEYADLTIYNFTEMTRNIGTFTAAGLDLETSTSAIKGIANLAAVSGSTSTQASTAMYQLSQALAAGRVGLQDWNSVVNAGMGGKVFQSALIRTAKHMGIVVDETKNFRDTISGGDTWLTADILSETLKQFSGDLDEAALKAQGWSDQEIKEITGMAKTAVDAATVVKTFSQLLDTANEQVGSGWTKTWQIIFGDFEESKALWTSVYKALSPYIDAMSDLRNEYLEFWKENEGRDKVLEAISNIWSGLVEVIDEFSAAFKKAFPIIDTFGEKLVDISDRFLKFSERFKSTKKAAEDAVKSTTKLVSSISDAEKEAANAIWYSGKYGGGDERRKNIEAEGLSYENVQAYLEALIDTNFNAEEANKRFMISVEETTDAVEDLSSVEPPATISNLIQIMSNAAGIFKNLISDAKKIGTAIKNAFTQVFNFSDALQRVVNISDRFKELSDTIRITDSALDKITRIGRGVFSVFKMIGDAAYGIARALFDIFQKLFPSMSEAGGNALESIASIGDMIYEFSQTHDIAQIVYDAIMKLVDVFETLPDRITAAKKAVVEFFSNLLDKIKETTGIDVKGILSGIRDAFGSLFTKLKESTGIDIPSIFSNILTGLKTVATDIIHLDFKGALNTVSDAFVSFKDAIKKRIDEADPESLFGKFINGMKAIVSKIRDVFSNLFSGGSGEGTVTKDAEKQFDIFEFLAKVFTTAGAILSKAWDFIYELFSTIFGFIGGIFTEGIDENDSAFEKVRKIIGNIGSIAADIFKIIAPYEGLQMAKDVTSVPKSISELIGGIGEAFQGIANRFSGGGDDDGIVAVITKIINSILKLAIAVAIFSLIDSAKLGVAIGAITTLFGELIGSMVIMQKYMKHDIDYAFITAAISQIASAMFKMSLSVALISILDPLGVAVAVGAITYLIAGLIGAMVAMQKLLKADVDLTLVTAVFGKIVTAVAVLSILTAILAHKDPIKLATATGAITVLMFAVVGVVAILQKTYNPSQGQTALKNMSYIAGLAVTLAQAVKMLVKPVKEFSAMDPESMLYGILGVTNLLLALTGVLYLLSKIKMDKSVIATAMALVTATIAVTALTDAAVKLGEDGSDKVLASVGGIFAMIGALAALVGLMVLISKISSPAQIIAVSIALTAAVMALNGLIPVMLILGNMEPEKLGSALIGLGLALLSLTAVLAILSYVGGANVLLVAAGLLVLSAAVNLFIPPLIKMGEFVLPIIERLTNVKWQKIGKGLAIIAVGLIAMLVAAPVLAVFGAGLLVVGIALAVISAAIFIAADAFLKFALALQLIALVWPSVSGILSDIGTDLGKGLVNFVTAFMDGLSAILAKIRQLAPEIAETIKVLLISVLQLLLGSAGTIAGYLLDFFIEMLTMFEEDLPVILSIIGRIITTILDWLAANVLEWSTTVAQILMDLITGAITGLTSRIDELVTAIFDFLIALNNSLATNLETKGTDLLLAIGRVITAVIELVKKAVTMAWDKIEKVGGDLIFWIVEGVKGKVSDITTYIKTFFEGLPEALADAISNLKDLGESIIESIKQGIIDKWGDLKNSLGELGDLVLEKLGISLEEESPSKATTRMGEYLDQGIIDGAENKQGETEGAMSDVASGALGAFGDKINELGAADYNICPNVNVTPEVAMDNSNLDSAFAGLNGDAFDLNAALGDTDLTGGLFDAMNTSNELSEATAISDAQRHDDTETANALMEELNTHMSELVDSFGNGMINIPENATFNVPVIVDGQTMANATAPYLDVINANNYNLNRKGVTSR